MDREKQHRLYAQAGDTMAPAIARLARAMERNPEKARDLEQDIHCEIFRSLARFEEQCALRTWVYRVAHNVCAEHRLRASRRPPAVPLDVIEELPQPTDTERALAESHAIAEAHRLIRQLPTLDAQVMILWLEGESARDIADVTGIKPPAVATRIHRLKTLISENLTPSPSPSNIEGTSL